MTTKTQKSTDGDEEYEHAMELADKITNLVSQKQYENLPNYWKLTAISDAYRSAVNWEHESETDDALYMAIVEFVGCAEGLGAKSPLLTRMHNMIPELLQISTRKPVEEEEEDEDEPDEDFGAETNMTTCPEISEPHKSECDVEAGPDPIWPIDEETAFQARSLYPHESQELETVQKFIEEGMRMHARRLAAIEGLVTVEHFIEGVPKGLVMHRILYNLSDTHLRNKILHCPKRGPYGETDDGLTNLKRGAKKVFADCWKVLKKTFVISEDNLITQRVASENADVCLARMARMPTVAEGFAILKQMILNGEVIPLEIVVSCDDGNRVTWNTAGLLREVEVHLAEKRQLAEIGEKSNDIELRRLLHDLCLIDDPTIPDIEYVDGPSPGMCSGIQPEKSPRV